MSVMSVPEAMRDVWRCWWCTVVQEWSGGDEGWLRADAMLAYVWVVILEVGSGCAWGGVVTAGRS